MENGKIKLDTALLLAGHIASCLSVFLISAGGLMRILRSQGDLPDSPLRFGNNMQDNQQASKRSSYFDY